jgi:peptide/nickel transport system ATP-binding protein
LPTPIPGTAPNPRDNFTGCAFAPRCSQVTNACRITVPPIAAGLACFRPLTIEHVSLAGAAPLSATAGVHATERNPVLVASEVVRHYGAPQRRVVAVRSASLAIMPGEAVGIVGPSGCGKSTLLRVLAGMQPTSGGSIRYGRGGDRPAPGEVMPILQDAVASLDPYWPIWRSITEPLMARHRNACPSRFERLEIATAALADVGMSSMHPSTRPYTLSGGQCQRVAIARALINAPSLLIADEPTSALDVSAAAGILVLLRRAVERGMGLLVVSHDRKMLGSLCDRTLVMTDGVIADRIVRVLPCEI